MRVVAAERVRGSLRRRVIGVHGVGLTRAPSPYYLGVSGGFVKGVPMSENPIGTDGFEFVEFTAEAADPAGQRVRDPGLRPSAGTAPRTCATTPGRHQFHPQHGAGPGRRGLRGRPRPVSICAMAFRVRDAASRLRGGAGARRQARSRAGPAQELDIPAIEGIGGSALYLVDRYGGRARSTTSDFVPVPGANRDANSVRAHHARPSDPQRVSRPDGPLGDNSTSASSTSARSAISTSRASRPA